MTKFWMLRVEGGGSPTTCYHSDQTARLRAEQLAKQTRKPVVLLESVAVVEPDLPAPESTTVHWSPV